MELRVFMEKSACMVDRSLWFDISSRWLSVVRYTTAFIEEYLVILSKLFFMKNIIFEHYFLLLYWFSSFFLSFLFKL